jgi:hypothetical protein
MMEAVGTSEKLANFLCSIREKISLLFAEVWTWSIAGKLKDHRIIYDFEKEVVCGTVFEFYDTGEFPTVKVINTFSPGK